MPLNPTLWGRATSVNVQKAVWTLEELGIAYDRKDAGGKYGGLDTPEYGAMNPNRLVPTLQDGDLTLWESHAIVRYLAAQYGAGTLWPEDPARRAVCDQWFDWTASTFQPAWIQVFSLIVRVPSKKRDAAAIEKARQFAVSKLEIMESVLETRDFLSGDSLAYGDIAAGSALYRWFTMEIERPNLPAVAAWYERLKARPAYEKGVCVPYDELRAPEE